MIPYLQRLRALLQPFRLYAGGPLQRLARMSGLVKLFGPEVAAMEQLLPALPEGAFGPDPKACCQHRGNKRPGWAWCWAGATGV